jgi:hypothetical protein
MGRLAQAEEALAIAAERLTRRPGMLTNENLSMSPRRGRAVERKLGHAAELFASALAAPMSMGMTVMVDWVSVYLATAQRLAADLDSAVVGATQAADAARRSGSHHRLAGALLEQARLAALRGEKKRYEDLAHEALVAASEVGAVHEMISAIEGLGVAAARAESWAEAIRLLAVGLALADPAPACISLASKTSVEVASFAVKETSSSPKGARPNVSP